MSLLFYKSFINDDLSLLLELERIPYKFTQTDLIEIEIPKLLDKLSPTKMNVYNEGGRVEVTNSVTEFKDFDGEISGLDHLNLMNRKKMSKFRVDCLPLPKILKLIKATRLNFTLEVLEFGGLEAVHLPFGSNWEGINRTEMDLKVLTLTRPSNLISKWDLIIAIAIRVSRLIQILDLPKELQVLTLECVLGRVFDDECRFAIISRLACIDSVLVDKDSGFTAQRFIRNCF